MAGEAYMKQVNEMITNSEKSCEINEQEHGTLISGKNKKDLSGILDI